MSEGKNKDEVLTEGITRITALVERVRYRPSELLPSEIQNEFRGAVAQVNAAFGDRLPQGWDDLVSTTRLCLSEAAKPQRIPGCVEKLHSSVKEWAAEVIKGEQDLVKRDELLRSGQAITRSDWQLLAPAAQSAHFKSGKTIVD